MKKRSNEGGKGKGENSPRGKKKRVSGNSNLQVPG